MKILPKAILISVVLSALTLLLYAGLGTQIHMVADDYCTAFEGQLYGPIDGVGTHYQTIGARFTSFFLLYSLAPLQPIIHPWFPILILLLMLLSTTYLIYQLMAHLNFPERSKYLAPSVIILTFAFYRLMPSYQHAFWFAGIIVHTLPVIFSIFLIATILHYFRKTHSTFELAMFLLWTISAILILGGFTEVVIPLIGFIFTILFFATPLVSAERRKEYLIFVIVGGLTALVGLIIAIQSPGVANRRELIISGGEADLISPLQAIFLSFDYTLSYIFGEPFGFTYGQTFSIAFLGNIFVLVYVWGIFYLDRNPDYVLPAPPKLRYVFLASFLVFMLAIYTILFPMTYAASGVLPMRPIIWARFVQIIAVIVWVYLALVASQRGKILMKLRRAKTFSLVLIAISFLLVWSPLVSMYKLITLYPDYQTYSQSWNERHEILSNAESDRLIIVPPLVYDIEDNFVLKTMGTDPDFWINKCVARFYGVEAVLVDDAHEE